MEALLPYLPENALPFIKKWLHGYTGKITLVSGRKRKLGDFSYRGKTVTGISINTELPPEYFFFTLTHEIAHYHAFLLSHGKETPHGATWKRCFSALLTESIDLYSDALRPLILRHAEKPKASAGRTCEIHQYFYPKTQEKNNLEQLLEHSEFIFRGKRFRFMKKMRTRYVCECVLSQRKYSFSPFAEITPIEKTNHE